MPDKTKTTSKLEKSFQILHLEDDAIDAELVQAALDSANILYKITRVQTSGEFSGALHKGGYDLILADYRLPNYDGISALSFVRERYPDIPFIFVSGTMGEDAAIQALTEGATDYVLKQKLSRLAPAVRRALRDAENRMKRKQAEAAQRESEAKLRAIFENSVDAIGVSKTGVHTFVNPAYLALFDYADSAELIGKPILDLIAPSHHEQVMENVRLRAKRQSAPAAYETRGLRKDSSEFDMDVHTSTYELNGEIYTVVILRDVTERKQHELERESIISVSNSLRKATTRAGILTVILDQVIALFEADGSMLALPDPIVGGTTIEMGRGVVGERFTGLNIPPSEGVSGWVIANKKPYLNNHADVDALFHRPELLGDSHCVVSVPLIAQEQAIGALWIARQINFVERDLRLLNAIADIAANAIYRVMLYEQTEERLRHLIALHQIDIAISANLDLNITLNVILNNAKNELEVNAASILLLDPVTHTLDYAAGNGFRTHGIEQSHVKLGDGYAGRAALECHTVSCPDLRLGCETFSRSSLLVNEEFASHYATPLVVKGQVKGVLEVFHQKTLDPTQEWLDYFETLATQVAIAIENASLLENLQRSNTELILAYDATIEGWSRALDMRDRETEGHSQRVTEIALQLASKMGMSDMEKLDLRRGALLHDIGKMGIPDSILLKPGKLTDAEWEIMSQHPVYAYEMLAPISYLKQALDIPYCHHEKWHGSGYPRCIKGKQIPLAARIFTVADVFDALTSDRPYRPAWSKEDAYQYIREQSGKHFDPDVVSAFLEIHQDLL